MILAIINGNKVSQVVTIPDESFYGQYAQNAQAAIDITNTVPQPQVGWSFNGSTLLPPPSNSTGPVLITKLAMLQRFTMTERLNMLTYINANPSSLPAVLMQNIQVATFIDLNRVDTKTGLAALVSMGFLTPDRANTILTTTPTALEIYTG